MTHPDQPLTPAWELLTHEGAQAELHRIPDHPDARRVSVQSIDVGPAWAVQLVRPGHSVTEGREYRVRFRARADQSRSIAVSVKQFHPPWAVLGLYREVELTADWRDYEVGFSAEADEPNAVLGFDLGGSNIAVDIDAVEMEQVPITDRVRPTRSYLLCATARCGSNMLSNALARQGSAGRPQEYFLYWHAIKHEADDLKPEMLEAWSLPVDAYLDKVLRLGTTYNGIFGAKLMWSYMDVIEEKLRTLPGHAALTAAALLNSVLPDLHYLHVVREDKVRQAVSLAKAMQSGIWYRVEEEAGWDSTRRVDFATSARAENLRYDYDEIAGFHKMLHDHDDAWRSFFREAGITPYTVRYEDLSATPTAIIREVLDHLGVPLPHTVDAGPSPVKRQSDALNEDWAARFAEDRLARGDAPPEPLASTP